MQFYELRRTRANYVQTHVSTQYNLYLNASVVIMLYEEIANKFIFKTKKHKFMMKKLAKENAQNFYNNTKECRKNF